MGKVILAVSLDGAMPQPDEKAATGCGIDAFE